MLCIESPTLFLQRADMAPDRIPAPVSWLFCLPRMVVCSFGPVMMPRAIHGPPNYCTSSMMLCGTWAGPSQPTSWPSQEEITRYTPLPWPGGQAPFVFTLLTGECRWVSHLMAGLRRTVMRTAFWACVPVVSSNLTMYVPHLHIGKMLTGGLTCIGATKLLGDRANTQAQMKSKATALLVHHPNDLTTLISWCQLALPKK